MSVLPESDICSEFCAALKAYDVIPPKRLRTDGRLHRCDADGGSGKGDAAYLLWIGNKSAVGGYCNWRTGVDWIRWTPKSQPALTPAERAYFRTQCEEARRKAAEDKVQRQAAAKLEAAKLLDDATEVSADHSYLVKKGIGTHGLLAFNDHILVPMRDISGTVHNLQKIGPEGDKRFLFGGRVQGCFYLLGEFGPVICLVEGFATGATVREATGLAVAIAFNAGNLQAVALALARKGYRLIVCADDDRKTTHPIVNPGRTKALELVAMLKVKYPKAGHAVAFPAFGDTREDQETDFNDMAARTGNAAVKATIERAMAATPPTPPDGVWEDGANTDHARGDARAERKRNPLPYTLAKDLREDEDKEWMLEDWLGLDEISAFYGPPEAGKSTVVVDIGGHVAAGLEWNGRRVHRCGVLYCAVERGAITRRRLRAWIKENKGDARPTRDLRGLKPLIDKFSAPHPGRAK
jgi:putative DNA primase/helicase